jgi:hypothetical protein
MLSRASHAMDAAVRRLLIMLFATLIPLTAFADEASPPPLPPPPLPPPPPPAEPLPQAPPIEEEWRAPAPPASGAYTHDGFYLRFGLGAGYGAIWSAMDDGARGNVNGGAFALSLRLGGTPGDGLVVGGGIEIVGIALDTIPSAPAGATRHWRSEQAIFGPFVDWYPRRHGPWHVGALAGLSGAIQAHDNPDLNWSTTTFGGALFGGYDAWIGPETCVGISGRATSSFAGRMRDEGNNDVGRDAIPLTFTLDLSILYH